MRVAPGQKTPPCPVLVTAVPRTLPEEKKDAPRRLSPEAVRGLELQVWPERLQQPWVQLLRLIENEQGLAAALPRLPHLVCEPLLRSTGSCWGPTCPLSLEGPCQARFPRVQQWIAWGWALPGATKCQCWGRGYAAPLAGLERASQVTLDLRW